jgi:hypothetical protein
VPQPVAEPVHAAPIVGLQEVAVLVQVRDVAERLVPEAALSQGRRARPRVQRPVEALGEGDLLVVGERLIAEHEHGVLVHPFPKAREGLRVVDAPKLDRTDLGDEVRMELVKCQRHAAPS